MGEGERISGFPSSNVLAFTYYPGGSLSVEFKDKNGVFHSEYIYPGVRPEAYNGLLAAASKGKYLSAHFKGRYGEYKIR